MNDIKAYSPIDKTTNTHVEAIVAILLMTVLNRLSFNILNGDYIGLTDYLKLI